VQRVLGIARLLDWVDLGAQVVGAQEIVRDAQAPRRVSL
jgi:hypothetical protein